MSIYEQDALLAQYLDLHFGEDTEVLPWQDGPRAALGYPGRCVHGLIDPARLTMPSRALDLGCAVGRSSFELRTYCDEVVGIDLSHRFIDVARRLAEAGRFDFYRYEEGALTTPVSYRVPETLQRDQVTFEVGDACRLRGAVGRFDVVLNANLIDRLPDPEAFLRQLPALVQPGGQLILSSPFTWLEAFTPKHRWIGGRTSIDGVRESTWDKLCERLESHFSLLTVADLPFLIREHARKYQWSVARAGCWLRHH